MNNICKLHNNISAKFLQIVYWCILALFGIFFLCMNCLTPIKFDDFAYMLYFAADSEVIRPTSTPVSWESLLPSMWHHYCCVNGRFTSHIIVQMFCGLLGKNIFNIVNTIICMWQLHLIISLSSKSKSVVLLSVAIAAFFLFLPVPGEDMLWVAGAINYLWPTTFALAILKYISSDGGLKYNKPYQALAFIIGVIVGWMQESVSIGVSGGLFIWFLLNREKFTGINQWLTIGLWLGTLLIIVSPGTFNRIESGNEIAASADVIQMVASRLLVITMVLLPYILPFIALIICFILFIGRTKALWEKISLSILVFTVSLIFIYLLGIANSRIFYATVVFSLWCILTFCHQRLKIRSIYMKSTIIVAAMMVSI